MPCTSDPAEFTSCKTPAERKTLPTRINGSPAKNGWLIRKPTSGVYQFADATGFCLGLIRIVTLPPWIL